MDFQHLRSKKKNKLCKQRENRNEEEPTFLIIDGNVEEKFTNAANREFNYTNKKHMQTYPLEQQNFPSCSTGTSVYPERVNNQAFSYELQTKVMTSIFPNGLENLLKSVNDGQIVLLRKDNLDNHARQKLVKIIIDFIIQNNSNHSKSNSEFFSAVADEIVNFFPYEKKEIYYMPYEKKTGKTSKILPRGKLYNRYQNFRKYMKIACSAISADEYCNADDSCKNNSNESTEENHSSYNNVTCLQSNNLPEILPYWKNSYALRMTDLSSCETTQEYFNKFPPLTLPDGYKLLLEDFYEKYGNTTRNCIYTLWPPIADIILSIARNRKIIKMNELSEMAGDKITLSLKVLPWLFQPVTLSKVKGKFCRLSKLEIAESFFMHIKAPEELEEKINERIRSFAENNCTVPPFVVAVGNLNVIQTYYLVYDRQKYLFNDCLSALDANFKIIFALNLNFPLECKSVWHVVDNLIYKIDSAIDPASSVVITEIEKGMMKS